jgi:hypothetical protein
MFLEKYLIFVRFLKLWNRCIIFFVPEIQYFIVNSFLKWSTSIYPYYGQYNHLTNV